MTRTTRTTRAALIVGIATCCLGLSSCSLVVGEQPDAAAQARAAERTCTSVGGPGPTTVILTAGKVPGLERVTNQIVAGNMTPAAVYQRLSSTDEAKGGIVVLAQPNAKGDLHDISAFDLRTDGTNEGLNGTDAGAAAMARRDCLVEDLRRLPVAAVPPAKPDSSTDVVTEADVITSVPAAVAAARSRAGGQRVELLVVGLDRSNLGGKLLAQLDLRDDVREQSLDALARAGVKVPSLAGDQLSIRFVAPGDGLPSHLKAGFQSLATDLCTRFAIADCRTVEDL